MERPLIKINNIIDKILINKIQYGGNSNNDIDITIEQYRKIIKSLDVYQIIINKKLNNADINNKKKFIKLLDESENVKKSLEGAINNLLHIDDGLVNLIPGTTIQINIHNEEIKKELNDVNKELNVIEEITDLNKENKSKFTGIIDLSKIVSNPDDVNKNLEKLLE